ESESTVDGQDAAVRAVADAVDRVHPEGLVDAYARARGDHGFLERAETRAEAVDEETHLDARPRPLFEGGGEARRHLAVIEDVHLEVDRPLGPGDRGEHRGKDVVAVLEERRAV